MTSRVCTNGLCGATSSSEWKKGWSLRSGEIARLCHKCGTAYEQLVFCDIFHSKDSGWRECASCGKHLHCGCIASSSLFELLDSGGVNCISCLKSGLHSISSDEKPKEFHHSTENIGETRSISMDNQLNGLTHDEQNQSSSTAAADGHKHVVLSCNDDTNGFIAQLKLENNLPPSVQGSTYSSTLNLEPLGSSQNVKSDIDKEKMGLKDLCETRVQTNLTISLPAPSGITNPFPDAVTDDKDTIKTISSFQHGSRYCHLLPKPPNSVVADSFETSINSASQIRAARPPTEGRVKCHLLPRYWPRITEEELLQITGDSNSTVVPLFEKVLSASDAGRIGRLVLPKACAEAYFPTISQPEGLPLRIQDVKGKEWVFQFRFWPNNNSRMYVLEGVTPCIQSMQLQAGDTVTFSRMDPEGKLLMGFRKASNTTPIQETHLSAIRNRTFSSEPFFSGVIESLPIMSGYPALLRSLKGSMEPHLTTSSEQLNSANGDSNWNIAEKHRVKTRDGSVPLSLLVPERKRSRNIGSKSKRLLIDSQDALELKLTWEEMQDMLRPPPTAKPTSVTVEDQVFEEYEEPPVFGKRSIFTVRLSGEHEQWVQCDSCFKWRRIPADYLLPPNWRCVDNVWDQSRCSCASPDELSPRELQNLLKVNNDLKRRRCATKRKPTHEHESAILVTPTNAPVVGDDTSDYGDTSVATTTKHPRHRPGCSCIVCIQPPSGKGKHKPTCTCNVCMTVKRRFKTLMMRNKKRQSEREAEIAQRNQFVWGRREETDVYRSSQPVVLLHDPIQNEAGFGLELEYGDRKNNHPQLAAESGKGLLDLNCQSQREDLCIGSTRVSMMSLLQEANLPLEAYLKQNGLASLMCEQQASSGSHLVQQATGESMERLHEDQHQQEEVDEELCVAADKIPNDHR